MPPQNKGGSKSAARRPPAAATASAGASAVPRAVSFVIPALPGSLGSLHVSVNTAHLLALVQAILAVAAAFGLDLTSGQSEALLGLSAVLGGTIIVGEAQVHKAHVQALADAHAANVDAAVGRALIESGVHPEK